MADEPEEDDRGWRVVEGPGTETTDEDIGPLAIEGTDELFPAEEQKPE